MFVFFGICFFIFLIFFGIREYQLQHFEKTTLSEPVQKRIFFGKKWEKEEFKITPRAEYKIAAKIMTTHPINDFLRISPLDFGVAWGPMADEKILSFFSWSHSGRTLSWRQKDTPSLEMEIMKSHAGNIHAIPANENISIKLQEITPGDNVFFQGKLVDVKNMQNGEVSKTSLSRKDTGIAMGASCELFWIEEVEILKKKDTIDQDNDIL